MFGNAVPYPVLDVTPTHLSNGVLATLRQADYVAHSILKYSGDCYTYMYRQFAIVNRLVIYM